MCSKASMWVVSPRDCLSLDRSVRKLKPSSSSNSKKNAAVNLLKDWKSCLKIWKCQRNYARSSRATTRVNKLKLTFKWRFSLKVTGPTIRKIPSSFSRSLTKSVWQWTRLLSFTTLSLTMDACWTGNLLWAMRRLEVPSTRASDMNSSALPTRCSCYYYLTNTQWSPTNSSCRWRRSHHRSSTST